MKEYFEELMNNKSERERMVEEVETREQEAGKINKDEVRSFEEDREWQLVQMTER